MKEESGSVSGASIYQYKKEYTRYFLRCQENYRIFIISKILLRRLLEDLLFLSLQGSSY